MIMKLFAKEHYELIAEFEKDIKTKAFRVRFDKEPQELWLKSRIYQDGETNKLFIAYRLGYSLARGKLL